MDNSQIKTIRSVPLSELQLLEVFWSKTVGHGLRIDSS